MGVSVWVRLRHDLPGINTLDVNGKLLAKAIDALDREARRLGVRPLSDFYSVSKKQAMAEAAGSDLTDEEWKALADDHVWWNPIEGLASVNAFLAWAEQNLGKLHRPDAVLADLRRFREVLDAAAREGVAFNIAVDA